jgi:eukaryotic-like serine/threonine-protein kinase
MREKVFPILGLLAAIGLAYLSFDWAVGALIHGRRVVQVPDLSAKSVQDALNMLGPLDLGLVKEDEKFDKRFPAGAIVHQTPRPGMQVRTGRIIRVILSQGGEMLFVPDLLKQPVRLAQTSLQNLGLSIGEVERKHSLKFEKDTIMMTDPAPGAIVTKNGLVNLIVSAGQPPSDIELVPDFVGDNVLKAKVWAEAHQIPVSIKEEVNISRGDAEVLVQSPPGDTALQAGINLTLVVNKLSESSSGPADGVRIYYEVPQGAMDREVRVNVIDEAGEREVFRRSQAPGSKVDIRVQPKGSARARILVNGVVVQEQPLQ